MSSIATFFRTLPDTLQQPAALAMLGSLGAHLLVFATLPAFTSSNEPRPEAEVRRVRLIEPPQGSPGSQIARSQAGLPPVPNTPNSRIQLPIAGSGNSPIPNPLYTLPDLAPVPVPGTPKPQSSADRFNELLRRLRERQAQQQRQQQIPTPPPPKPPASPSPSPSPTIASGTTVTPFDPSTLEKPTPGQSGSTTATATPTPTPSPSPTPTPQTPNDRLLAATRYIPEGTTRDDYLQGSANLTAQLNTQFPERWDYIRLQPPTEPTRELDYPLPFALQNYRQNPIAIAVFVGKDGKPLPNQPPVVLQSTGYQILNDKAIEIVQKDANQPNRFPAIDQDRLRVFVYEFKFKAPNTGGTVSRANP
ncbi:hypothetical protein LEP3755_23740 [Leptolyngbya sp. NIES-3755]|nr:hypothetical protein LEP3755_23740 [Leptolyngbya sp. NIES-3755]